MRELRLKYRSKETILQVPAGWHELTPAQFIVVVRLYTGNMDEDTFIKQFYNLSDKTVRRLSTFQKYKLIELVEFIQDARTPHAEFFLSSLFGTELVAPGARLDGMCLQQFMMVDTFFSKYAATEKIEYLNAMVAYLYMGKNERFVLSDRDPDAVLLDFERHLSIVQSLDFDVRYAIFLNFVLIKRWLSRAYVHLFPEAEEPVHAKGQKMQPVNWLDVFDSFVGDNIPYMDKYQAMPCTDAFRIMNRKIREAKKR